MTPEEEKAFSDGIKAMFADGRLTEDTTGMEEFDSPYMAEGFKAIRGNGKHGFICPSGQAIVWETESWMKPWVVPQKSLPDTEDYTRTYRRWLNQW